MKYIKNRCWSCGGSIEFPSEGVGEIIACPHCEKAIQLRPVSSISYKRIAILLLCVFGVYGMIGGIVSLIPQKPEPSTPLPAWLRNTDVTPVFAPRWTPPASDEIISTPPTVIKIRPLPLPQDNPVADQLARANDIAARRLHDEEFGLLNNDNNQQPNNSVHNYYQSQSEWEQWQQTEDLDRITQIYQDQYNNSLYQPLK